MGSVFTNFNANSNFENGLLRPNHILGEMIERGEIDKVVQIGYDGFKHQVVSIAESSDVNVVLYRRFS
jgi:hypothetical protein